MKQKKRRNEWRIAQAMTRKRRENKSLRDFFPQYIVDKLVKKPKLGFVHVYTGEGKGKTTASLGLALRALGAGYKVAFLQIDKGFSGEEHYSERNLLRQMPNLTLLATGCERIKKDGRFRFGNTSQDFVEVKRALGLLRELILSHKYDVIVVDELLSGIKYGLIPAEVAAELILLHKQKGGETELVMTGHGLPKSILDLASCY